MKKLFLLILIIGSIVELKAQEQQNMADIDFLYQQILQLPSYKDQLKKDLSYVRLYQQLRKEMNTSDEVLVFRKLATLLMPLRDNHIALARIPDTSLKFSLLKPVLDPVEMEKRLSGLPVDSTEGIYFKQKEKYFIYQVEPMTYYVQSADKEELYAILIKNEAGSFDVIQFLFGSYPYVFNRNIKLLNGMFAGLNFVKDPTKTYFDGVERKEKYEYKTLNETIGYLSLGTFNSSNKDIKLATDFFNAVRPTINVKNLIVDVRNNGGGGFKNSKQFLDFLAKFKGEVYLLQNAYTVSNAEQFILKLKESRKVTTMGETTMGKITYGNNYGKRFTLPSKRFTFYPTDMKGSSKELAFESIGIKPDVFLDPFSEDWVIQAIKYIKSH